jgi:hypothetical protein
VALSETVTLSTVTIQGAIGITAIYDQTLGNYSSIQYDDEGWLAPNCTGIIGANEPCVFTPGLGFTAGSPSSGPSMSQPFTVTSVAGRTGNFTSYQFLFTEGDCANGYGFSYNNAANSVRLGSPCGGNYNVTASDSVVHELLGIVQGSSSNLVVDGASNTGSVGTNSVAGPILLFNGFSPYFYGFWLESLAWNTGLSSTQRTTYCTGVRAMWNTPTPGSC